MNGAKIAKKFENPIDNFIVHQLCEPVSETLYKHKNHKHRSFQTLSLVPHFPTCSCRSISMTI